MTTPSTQRTSINGTFGLSNGTEILNPKFAGTVLRSPSGAGLHPWVAGAILSHVAGIAAAQSPVVDLHVSPDGLRGRVALRNYQLTATEDDTYAGEMQTGDRKVRFIVFGKSALWSMPPADQAALLPLRLSCARVVRDELGEPFFS